MSQKKSQLLSSILILLGVIVLSILLYVFRDRLRSLSYYGYPGIFILSILSNATLILPLPGFIIPSLMGAVFDPFWVAIASGLGAGIGELTGYLAGYSGHGVVENRQWYERIEGWMKKYGDIVILLMAIIPNPFFDVAGIISGVLKIPVYRFLLWCALGKIIKMLFLAYGGNSLANWFLQ